MPILLPCLCYYLNSRSLYRENFFVLVVTILCWEMRKESMLITLRQYFKKVKEYLFSILAET